MKISNVGIDCHIGYGFNKQFWRFIKYNGECQMKKQAKMDFVEFHNVALFVADRSMTLAGLGYYLEESMLRVLEFTIVNDMKEYLKVELTVCTRKETCERVDSHPENCDHHVVGLYYGMNLKVIFSREHFTGDENEMRIFLNSALQDINKLSEIQKKEKCRVLINAKETGEMTIEELLKFKDEFKRGMYPEHEEVVRVDLKKHKELKQAEVKNEKDLKLFLTYLYTCYRKIEMKLEKVDYPLLNMDNPDISSMEKIIDELEKAKKAYKEMDTNDFFKMYPVMKNLFWIYMKYLKISIHNNHDIDEGGEFLDAWEIIGQWLLKLNGWIPTRVNGTWYGSTTNQSIEPVLRVEGLINGVFGYVNMENAVKIEMPETPEEFKDPCPINCSNHQRKWICSTCSDVVVIVNDSHLVCSCGAVYFQGDTFTCNHPEHKINFLTENLPEELKKIVRSLKKCEKPDTNYPEIKKEIEELRHRIIHGNQMK